MCLVWEGMCVWYVVYGVCVVKFCVCVCGMCVYVCGVVCVFDVRGIYVCVVGCGRCVCICVWWRGECMWVIWCVYDMLCVGCVYVVWCMFGARGEYIWGGICVCGLCGGVYVYWSYYFCYNKSWLKFILLEYFKILVWKGKRYFIFDCFYRISW